MNEIQILFRGQDIFTDDWIYGYALPDADIKDRWYIVSPYTNFLDKSIVKSETIGQYSGMNDKLNNKIFVGDILTCINADNKLIHVKCCFGAVDRILVNSVGDQNKCSIYGFYFDYNGIQTYPICNNYQNKHDLEILEIVGNIFENPKLLNKNI